MQIIKDKKYMSDKTWLKMKNIKLYQKKLTTSTKILMIETHINHTKNLLRNLFRLI